jgi:AcrR family transcriptional regulator
MPNRLKNVRIDVSTKVFVKDPYSSGLGIQIITHALPMIDSLGMEMFTFRKLAAEIGTTESAVYRYFDNKHKLLLYYVSWYWGWVGYNLAFGTMNINDPEERLERAVKIITSGLEPLENSPFEIDVLLRVVVAESSKAYLTKQVDDENKEGLFTEFKNLMNRVSELITSVAPEYPYAHSLASLFIESHLNQIYFSEHLPALSDLGGSAQKRYEFYRQLIFNTILPWRS